MSSVEAIQHIMPDEPPADLMMIDAPGALMPIDAPVEQAEPYMPETSPDELQQIYLPLVRQ
jgi:hypothetical protein